MMLLLPDRLSETNTDMCCSSCFSQVLVWKGLSGSQAAGEPWGLRLAGRMVRRALGGGAGCVCVIMSWGGPKLLRPLDRSSVWIIISFGLSVAFSVVPAQAGFISTPGSINWVPQQLGSQHWESLGELLESHIIVWSGAAQKSWARYCAGAGATAGTEMRKAPVLMEVQSGWNIELIITRNPWKIHM